MKPEDKSKRTKPDRISPDYARLVAELAPSTTAEAASPAPPDAPASASEPSEDARSAIRCLFLRASRGDEAAMPEVRAYLAAHPEASAHFGNLVWHAEQALLNRLAPNDLVARETIAREADALKKRLAQDVTSELERLLSESLVLSWLEVQIARLELHTCSNFGTPAISKLRELRLDRANARFLAASKHFAVIRKLALPEHRKVKLFSATA